MKITLMKDGHHINTITRFALGNHKGRTFVFGVDSDEIKKIRLLIPHKVSFSETNRQWWIGNHVSQGIPIGESVVCWLAMYEDDRTGQPFFLHEGFGMANGDPHFSMSDEPMGIYDITTPDDIHLLTHAFDAKLEGVLRVVYDRDFDYEGDKGVIGTVGLKCVNDVMPEIKALLPTGMGMDSDPSEPEELEPEFDERPHVLRPRGGPITFEDTQELLDGIKTAAARQQVIVRAIKAAYPNDFAGVMVVRSLATRYLAMMKADDSSHLDYTENRFGDKTSRVHLRWMLGQLIDNNEQSLTKKHRWLGYIQGLLITYGYTTVDREREYTRDIFRGQ